MRRILCALGFHTDTELRRVPVYDDPEGESYVWRHVWSCRRCPVEWGA